MTAERENNFIIGQKINKEKEKRKRLNTGEKAICFCAFKDKVLDSPWNSLQVFILQRMLVPVEFRATQNAML